MSHNFNYFTPITPSKTLNCVLNSAINYENFSINYENLGICSVPYTLPVINQVPFVGDLDVDVDVDVDAEAAVTPDSQGDVDEIIPPPKNKKQKVSPDRKPGEKRQKKYFWAKIDAPRPYTPASKTPKVATSKPPKSKTPKSFKPKTPKVAKAKTPKPKKENAKIKPIDCSKISEHVDGELIIASTCKMSLNFDATKTTDLESCDVPKEVVESARGLNLGNGDMAIVEVKPSTKIKTKVTMVYKRRFTSKCLQYCQKLVPNFDGSCKKKRLQRKKVSFGELKKFKGFNDTYLDGDLLDRILTMKGKLRMLLPTKVDLTQDLHRCVYSLLSLRVPFQKNKRLSRARPSKKKLALAAHPSPATLKPLKDQNSRENIPAHKSLSADVYLAESEVNRDKAQPCTDDFRLHAEQTQRESDLQLVTLTPSTPKGPTESRRGRKPHVIKKKNSRTTYNNGDLKDHPNYIHTNKLSDKIMKDFTEKFGSLRLNEDPKTWVMVVANSQDNRSDSQKLEEERNELEEEKMKKLQEEIAILKEKTDKFTAVMREYQGSKEYIKWNGSVLDSVVGVFLTQNVSDILSSNAYMSLAAKYPIKPPTSMDSEVDHEDAEGMSSQESSVTVKSSPQVIVEHPVEEKETTLDPIDNETTPVCIKEDEGFYKDAEGMSSQESSVTVGSSPQVIVEHPVEEKETTLDPIDDETTPERTKEDEGYYEDDHEDTEGMSSQESSGTVRSSPQVIVEHPVEENETTLDPIDDETTPERMKEDEEYYAALAKMEKLYDLLEAKKKVEQADLEDINWEVFRVRYLPKSPRKPENQDSVDWESVRKANYLDTAEVIRPRGQHRIIACKIQKTLNRLLERHGSLDLEWLRNAPTKIVKCYLLSFYGLGLKSVECLRLLTLKHPGFPVDVNISRIAIRLGWVPIQPLPPGMPFHLLQKYPLENEIQKYLWPRLDQDPKKLHKLYTLHYQMITFGKVFCHKRSPNCQACPFKRDCKYYASRIESQRLALPGPKDWKTKKSKKIPNPFCVERFSDPLPRLTLNNNSCTEICLRSTNLGSYPQLPSTTDNISQNPEYLVEVPLSPIREVEEEDGEGGGEEDEEEVEEGLDLVDIEDCCDEYMYHLKLNTKDQNQSLLNNCQENDLSSQNFASKEMVLVSPTVTFPLPKQVKVSRLRTEHQVYELPREHPLLYHLNLEPQLGNVPYLLATWQQDQVKKSCGNSEECPCSSDGGCACRQDDLTIPGTLLIPVRTAMRAFFPLNGTYFQTNEVFMDLETCERPLNVPRNWIWNLKKRTLYCGSSTSAIVKGTTELEIQQCFRNGFVCTRGFNRQTRTPEALSMRFHYRTKAKPQQEKEDEQ